MLNIIQEDLNRVAKITVSDTQYGFSAGKSTTDAIFTLKLIGQAHMAVDRRLHMVFVDFRKAFDSVIHHKLLEIIANLYNGAHGSISWKGLTSNLRRLLGCGKVALCPPYFSTCTRKS